MRLRHVQIRARPVSAGASVRGRRKALRDGYCGRYSDYHRVKETRRKAAEAKTASRRLLKGFPWQKNRAVTRGGEFQHRRVIQSTPLVAFPIASISAPISLP